MKLIIQQVNNANIHITDENIDEIRTIEKWIVIYIGIGKNDTTDYTNTIDSFLEKLKKLRWRDDEEGNLSATIQDINGELLIVSNFTLYANHKNWTKMDFSASARFTAAKPVYEYFVQQAKKHFPQKVKTGEFWAMMNITAEVAGPVNYVLEI